VQNLGGRKRFLPWDEEDICDKGLIIEQGRERHKVKLESLGIHEQGALKVQI
jgi:hypothetical protein